ncbi:hypothetical protein [Rubrivirga sp. IMCC43871]|uniref:hypothetical protein n=1 Tax=Rubrivirga sp. IMCC43871 TaxID=3391575 RepID=UPI00398FB34E
MLEHDVDGTTRDPQKVRDRHSGVRALEFIVRLWTRWRVWWRLRTSGRHIARGFGGVIITFLGLAVVGWAASQTAGTPQERAQLAGVVLQVLGVSTTAVGLVSTRKSFGLPSAVERMKTAAVRTWSAMKGGSPPVAHRVGLNIIAPEVIMEIEGEVIRKDETLEERVDRLEHRLERYRTRLNKQLGTARKQIDAVNARVDGERKERSASVADLQSDLRLHATGNMRLTWCGLAWTVAGMSLTSATETALRLIW